MRATLEHERKLNAPAGFRLPPLGGRLLEPRLFTSVYYDVPGGSLATAGITLRRRVEHGNGVWQLKLPSEDARLELEADGGPAAPPDELLRLLRAHLRHGPLAPVSELRTRRSGELVARNGTTVEVTVDEVAVMDARRVRDEFVEVELELRSGKPGDVEVLARKVAKAGAQPGDGQPKLFRVLGRERNGSALPETPFEALRALLRAQLREIEAHDPGTRLGRDPESLHEMRVAVRRFRALLRAGRKLVATDTARLDTRLKALGSVLGEVRDLDVLLERLEPEAASLGGDDAADAKALLRTLRRERSRKRSRLRATLDSEPYLALLDDLGEMLDTLEPATTEVSLDALARKAGQKLSKLARALPDDPADEQLHALRIAGKRARYAAELAGRQKVVKRAKLLQDVLGTHQDAVVAVQRLRKLAAGAPVAQAFAAGRLVEREHARRADARAAWPKVWKKLRKVL
jgi:CHAD domain-containing protein